MMHTGRPRAFKPPIIVGFQGKAGMGKNTAAEALREKYEKTLSPQVMAFADILRESTRMMYGLPVEVTYDSNKDRDLNELLSELGPPVPGGPASVSMQDAFSLKPTWDQRKPQFAPGTTFRDLMISHADLARLQGGDYVFVRAMHNLVEFHARNLGTKLFLIPDVRLPMEAQWIQQNGGLVIYISPSEDYESPRTLSQKAQNHETEKGSVPSGRNVRVVENDGKDLEAFKKSIMDIFIDWVPQSEGAAGTW